MENNKIKIYFASRIFNFAEIDSVVVLTALLCDMAKNEGQFTIEAFNPMIDNEERSCIDQFPLTADLYPEIQRRDMQFLDKADVCIAILDGTDVDSGVSVEVAYSLYKKKMPVIGLITDLRARDGYVNPMFYDTRYKNMHMINVNFLDYIESYTSDYDIRLGEKTMSMNDNFTFNKVNTDIITSKKLMIATRIYEKLKQIFLAKIN